MERRVLLAGESVAVAGVPTLDLGDAPDSSNRAEVLMMAYPPGGTSGTVAHFPTTYDSVSTFRGPLHRAPEELAWLGRSVTLEEDADSGADEDEINNIVPPKNQADNDGRDDGLIDRVLTLTNGGYNTFDYVVTAVRAISAEKPLYVNAWFDWNRDGDWDDAMRTGLGRADEWAVQNQAVSFGKAGEYRITTPQFLAWHPVGAAQVPLWMRITLAEQPWSPSPLPAVGSGGSGPAEGYAYGETEDYYVTDYQEKPFDYGDAPQYAGVPGYPTTLAADGARHFVNPAVRLGKAIDAEFDGQPSVLADADDLNPATQDDEDGVQFPTLLVPGGGLAMWVNASAAGYLDAWIDFNGDGSFAQAGDQIFTSKPLVAGDNYVSGAAPATATPGIWTYARYRFSTAGGLSYTGAAADGEVEDYRVWITGRDYGDAPAPYPTAGAYHYVDMIDPVTGLGGCGWLGDATDKADYDSAAMPEARANGDDLSGARPDDEDGVVIPALQAGVASTITFQVSGGGGYVDGWIDYNDNGAWEEPAERVLTGYYADGIHSVTVTPPATSVVGHTFARFRINYDGPLSPSEAARGGEVEDHYITIANTPPVAEAGGPYRINAGEGLVFDGRQSYDPNAAAGDAIVKYEWDFDNDGVYELAGATAGISWDGLASLPLNIVNIVCLRVTDTYGATGTDTAELRIVKADPDYFEPNNRRDRAIDLGIGGQTRMGLSIDNAEDEDWIRWESLSSGEFEATINFDNALGDLDLELWDGDRRIAASNSGDNVERVVAKIEKDHAYHLRIVGRDGAINPAYELGWHLMDPITNYAVLFAGGIRPAKNFTRYYDNTKNLYQTLTDSYGLDPDNIYVLYADGTDDGADLTTSSGTIDSDMSYATHVLSATNANLEDVLVDILAPEIDGNDHFLFWSFDHGGGDYDVPANTGEEVLCGWYENVADEDLADWLREIDAGYATYVFTQCFAGGMLAALEPLAANEHGSAATNHYEFSWGDAFAAAWRQGLIAHNNGHEAYEYAYAHDACATDGEGPGGDVGNVEHPWEAGSSFPVFGYSDNTPPWLDELLVVPFVPPWEEVILPYEWIDAAAMAGDREVTSLSYRIESVEVGTLLKDGRPVVPGQTLLGVGESLTWVAPATKASGVVDAFTIRAYDGLTVSDRRLSVPVLLGTTGEGPVAEDDRASVEEGASPTLIPVRMNDKGVGRLSVASVGAPRYGTAELRDGEVFYTPLAGFSGMDEFIYYLQDDTGMTDIGTVSVKVAEVNDPPEAYPDSFTFRMFSVYNPVDVLDNDYDAESKPLTFDHTVVPYPLMPSVTVAPAHGTLSLNPDRTFTYSPDAGYVGPDSFKYVASDGVSDSNEALVTIQVVGPGGVFGPTDEDDTYYLRMGATGRSVEIMHLAPSSPPENYSIPLTMLHGLAFFAGGGDDTLTVDATFGNPLPPDGLVFTGGTGRDGVTLYNPAAGNLLRVDANLVTLGASQISLTNASASLAGSRPLGFASLTLASGRLAFAGSLEVHADALSIAQAGVLDIGDGDLWVKAGVGDAVLSGIESLIGQGRIVSPSSDPLEGPAAILAPAAGEVHVKRTLRGDLNLDLRIDGDDYYVLDNNALAGKASAHYGDGDVSGDGRVEGNDFFLADRAFLSHLAVREVIPASQFSAQVIREPNWLEEEQDVLA